MKKYIIIFVFTVAFLLLWFIYSIRCFEDIQKKNKLNEETQNNLYQAFLKNDIDSIDEILCDAIFYFNKKKYYYNDYVKLNISEFLKDDSKYIDIKKITFSATNMHNEYPLHFLVLNSNNIDGISGELWWEVEYRDGKLYSIKSNENDLFFEYLFINNNKKTNFMMKLKQ